MSGAPVEYLVISFPGNRFNGDIAPAIADLVDRGTVRILDLVFVKRDGDGNTTWFEYSDLEEGAAFEAIDGDADGLLNEEDLTAAAELLEPDSSALFILWEDLWATELAQAIRGAGGELVAGERIPRAAIDAALSAAGGGA